MSFAAFPRTNFEYIFDAIDPKWLRSREAQKIFDELQKHEYIGLLTEPTIPIFPTTQQRHISILCISSFNSRGVGKSSTIARLSGRAASGIHQKTIGLQMSRAVFPAKHLERNTPLLFHLSLFETTTAETSVHSYHYQNTLNEFPVVWYFFSMIDRCSLDDAVKCISLTAGRLPRSKGIIKILVGTHNDRNVLEPQITFQELQKIMDSHGIPVVLMSNVAYSTIENNNLLPEDITCLLNVTVDLIMQKSV